MHRRNFVKISCAAGIIAWVSPTAISQESLLETQDDLEQLFIKPPMSSWPQVYWFWMNGHVSPNGITRDLEAMKAAGIGGVFQLDAGTGIPEGTVAFGSDEWLKLKKHALSEAFRLGLEVTLHNCPGWSASGGPWITPELAMQQVTWSELVIEGGKRVQTDLPKPFHKLDYYRDIAVLAFPANTAEAALARYVASTNKGVIDNRKVSGQLSEGVVIMPEHKDAKGWLQFAFDHPVVARSITFQVAAVQTINQIEEPVFSGVRTSILLESSDDGRLFTTIAQISTGLEADLHKEVKFITFDFPVTKARYFRISAAQPRRLLQVRFSSLVRLSQFMEKAGFRFMYHGTDSSPVFQESIQQDHEVSAVALQDIHDLTTLISKEGALNWEAPPGAWILLRMGYTPTGAVNKAAPAAGTGLECDKFSKAALTYHLEHAMKNLLPEMLQLAKSGNAGLEIDSYEAGMQNWTAQLPQEFLERRKYSLIPYLLTITGRITENIDHTERFLWDFRQTLANLMAEHYYGHFAQWCRDHGFTSYVEPYDKGPFAEMQIGSKADVPMGEWWNGLFALLQGNLPIRRTPKLAASIAHTNGKKVAGAETFTSEPESGQWQEYPFGMKAIGDAAFVQGVNKMVLHRFVHQPHPTAFPGMTMGPWGSHIDRTNTWWPHAGPWFRYLARCQALLRQGDFVADLAYVAAEESAVFTGVERKDLEPAPPRGYNYDVVHAETVINRMRVEAGSLILPDGMRYRILVLQNHRAITLSLLHKIDVLLQQGAIIIGGRPKHVLGLVSEVDKAAFNELVNKIWGERELTQIINRRVGRGQVIWGVPLEQVLQNLSLAPDFTFSSRSGDAPVSFIHRKTADADIYFLAHARRSFEELVCTFRIKGKAPEVWDPATGAITPYNFYEQVESGMRVPLQVEPYGSLFIVFRNKAGLNPVRALWKDGEQIMSTELFPAIPQKRYPGEVNSFTITLWAKPETAIMLQPSIHMEKVAAPYTDFYAIYPPTGRSLYGDNHATAGLAIGRNGVAVWENENGVPELVLAAPVAISGWTHVALVYQDGAPGVFVNGTLIKKGSSRGRFVHPGVGKSFQDDGATYYNGDMTAPEVFHKILDIGAIRQLASKAVPVSTGTIPYVKIVGGKKTGMLALKNGSYSVQMKNGTRLPFVVAKLPPLTVLKGAWTVKFPVGMGAPEVVKLPELISLHHHHLNGVRYFSGTATYQKSFHLPATNADANLRWFLDLGRVEVIAAVKLNGEELGIIWKRPYRLEITHAVQKGLNLLEVKVANLWPNRLIGDEQLPGNEDYVPVAASGSFESLVGGGIRKLPQWYLELKDKPEDGRVTFVTWKHYRKEDPLLESGLIGPVTIQAAWFKTFV